VGYLRGVRDITYPPVILAAKAAFKLLGIKLLISGSGNIPTSGGALLTVNHISYVDFIFSGYAARPSKRLVRFMAKRELFDHRVSGPIMRSLHHIEVDRASGLGSYRQALKMLRAGEVVGIFPEATISRSFELKAFKSGASRMAVSAGVPVIPVIVWGTQRIYTKDHPRDLSRGKPVALAVGEPLHFTGADRDAEAVTLKEEMAKLLDRTTRSYPEMPPGAWWLPRSYGGSAPTPEEALALDEQEILSREARRSSSAGSDDAAR
jgi:1-acyl-sn-glycerol-3-phosphate acyltransferase